MPAAGASAAGWRPELVDEEVAETPALPGAKLPSVSIARAAREQVVEVEPPLAALLGFIGGVEIGELAAGAGEPALGRAAAAAKRSGGIIRARPLISAATSPTASRTAAFDPGPRRRSGPRIRALRSRTRGGSVRWSAARRRNWASASAWKVPAVRAPSTPSASSRSTSRRPLAARKVTGARAELRFAPSLAQARCEA
jgi:hypothetical protein